MFPALYFMIATFMLELDILNVYTEEHRGTRDFTEKNYKVHFQYSLKLCASL